MKKIIINPIYFAFLIFLFIKGYFLTFINYFVALIFHEFAHFYVAKSLGYNLQTLTIMPYGVCLNYNDEFFAEDDELKIAMAGPIINIILAIFTVATWWLYPSCYYFSYYFCLANISLALFNFLPCYPLDGGRILINFVAKKKTREFALNITIAINFVVAILLLILFIISIFNEINITFLLLSLFLLFGAISPKNKTDYNNLKMINAKKKMLNKGTSIKFIAVSDTTPLYKIQSKFSRYKYNVVYVVGDNFIKTYSENAIQKLMIKYSSTITIFEIFNDYCK